jgi:hypothetical protein
MYKIAIAADPSTVNNGSMPGTCRYPHCTHPKFDTDNPELIIHADLDEIKNAPMHVTHTDIASRFNGGFTEYHNDGLDEVLPASQAKYVTEEIVPQIVWSEPTTEAIAKTHAIEDGALMRYIKGSPKGKHWEFTL